ncbi:lipid-transfer protein [Nocardioides ginsengisoli]|uniref:Lipid-transfer protein n=1 Tax=Nocardioides ginsengisoli TaxID=363868 RepID=A0ABW3VVJ4_9ACTN
MTELTRRSGRSVLSLAREAALTACAAAGLSPDQVDGVVQFSMYDDSVPAEALGAAIGARDLTYVMDFAQGGQSAAHMVAHAAMAVACGFAESIVVFRAMNGRSGVRIGQHSAVGGGTEFRYPIGFLAYPQVAALWARRYMIETGASELDFAAIAIAERRWAQQNPRAILREPLTEESYLASRWVAEPFRLPDCTTEVDGAAAVLVTSVERARDLRLTPAVIASAAWATHGFDLDMGSSLRYDDYLRNYAAHLADPLWRRAGVGPDDVDYAEVYDCFTGALALNMEGLGLCEPGGAGRFAREGHTSPGGRLPTNTHGGLLSEGYVHGMNTVTEAVWQMQGLAGERQVSKNDVAVVSSGAYLSGSAIVLTKDR